jgi:GNAT superfamily N-acetyltransferase
MSRIVRARTAHLGPLANLMASSPLLHRYGVTARGARASLAEALRERDLVLVSVDGDAVIGFAWAMTTRALDRSAYLRLLLVSEEQQSRGVGAALLARVEREARASRCRHLMLLVP